MRTSPHYLDRTALDAAKSRIGIAAAWAALGLPGAPRASCQSPFREDRHPSFSVTKDRLWYDHATGEGGDVVAFIARARECDAGAAIKTLLDLAGEKYTPPRRAAIKLPQAPAREPEDDAPRSPQIPELTRPSVSDLAEIAEVRRWPFWGPLDNLARRGMLWSATVCDFVWRTPAWVLTDADRRAAQMRRMDGIPWQGIGAKAKTVRGSCASWPVGACAIGPDDADALLCEGGPDCLAVAILAWIAEIRVAPVAMLGASVEIHADALHYFSGRRVRIVEQNDNPSTMAGRRWAAQLKAAGATVDGWTPPAGTKDVADMLAGFPFEDLEEDPDSDLQKATLNSGLFAALTDAA